MKNRTIIISCGGTGGHIFPALEIAKSLKKLDANLKILFVGAINKMEMQKIPQQGFPIVGLWIQGLYRKSILKNTLFPLKLIISLIHAFLLLIYHKPIAVVGTGGFASGPVLFMASLIGLKTYIQEQNCSAGLTNKLLSKRVNQIFVAHEGMQKFFPRHKILNLGNPVRHSLKTDLSTSFISKSRRFFGLSNNKFTILVVGGSLGAKPINDAINKHLNIFKKDDIQLIWQTGKNDYNKYCHLNTSTCSVNKFIDRMDLAYSASDLILSRAGAIAIAEISYLSKPSILIPSPHVTDNHQKENADYLKINQACELVLEKNLMTSELLDSIRKLKNSAIRKQIGDNVNQLFNHDAAHSIAEIILKNTKNVK